jgi:hypothetical protein
MLTERPAYESKKKADWRCMCTRITAAYVHASSQLTFACGLTQAIMKGRGSENKRVSTKGAGSGKSVSWKKGGEIPEGDRKRFVAKSRSSFQRSVRVDSSNGITQAMYTISAKHPAFGKLASALLEQYGVLVVTDVFSPEECDMRRREIVESLLQLSDGVTLAEFEDFHPDVVGKLLPTPRAGVYGSRLSNSKAVWDIRSHPCILRVFKELYTALRGYSVDHLVTSLDSVEVLTPAAMSAPRGSEAPDWTHLDTAQPDATFACIQGQLILKDAGSGLRVSPGSHWLYERIVAVVRGGDGSGYASGGQQHHPVDWCPVTSKTYDVVRSMVLEAGGAFQVPVIGPEGSLVLHLSSVLHSTRAYADPGVVWQRPAQQAAVSAAASCSPPLPSATVDEAVVETIAEAAAGAGEDNKADAKTADAKTADAPAAVRKPKPIPGLVSASSARRARRRARADAAIAATTATAVADSDASSVKAGAAGVRGLPQTSSDVVQTFADCGVCAADGGKTKEKPLATGASTIPDAPALFAGWRIAVNLCYQPRYEVPMATFDQVKLAFTRNLSTNHSGKRVFPALPPSLSADAYTPFITSLVSASGDKEATAPVWIRQHLDSHVQALISPGSSNSVLPATPYTIL